MCSCKRTTVLTVIVHTANSLYTWTSAPIFKFDCLYIMTYSCDVKIMVNMTSWAFKCKAIYSHRIFHWYLIIKHFLNQSHVQKLQVMNSWLPWIRPITNAVGTNRVAMVNDLNWTIQSTLVCYFPWISLNFCIKCELCKAIEHKVDFKYQFFKWSVS